MYCLTNCLSWITSIKVNCVHPSSIQGFSLSKNSVSKTTKLFSHSVLLMCVYFTLLLFCLYSYFHVCHYNKKNNCNCLFLEFLCFGFLLCFLMFPIAMLSYIYEVITCCKEDISRNVAQMNHIDVSPASANGLLSIVDRVDERRTQVRVSTHAHTHLYHRR